MKVKTKLKRYEVTLIREIEHRAVVEVEARSPDEAIMIAENIADEPRGTYWREGDVLGTDAKVKLIAGGAS